MPGAPGPSGSCRGDSAMLDLVMLAIAFGLFALTIGYAYACERL
jgi:hypothetical protein